MTTQTLARPGLHFRTMAPQYGFTDACDRLRIRGAEGRTRFHDYILLHDYDPGQTYSLDTWRGWLEMFDAWDEWSTERDALR